MPTELMNFVVDHAAGTLFGAALLGAINLIWRSAHNRYLNPPSPFFGKYHLCQYSTTGSGKVIRGICEVKKHWLRGNVVTVDFEVGAVRHRFVGHAEQRRGVIYLHAVETHTEEEMTLIVKEPVAGGVQCCVGIVTGLSADKQFPCATHLLLTRKRIGWEKKIPELLPGPQMITATPLPLEAISVCEDATSPSTPAKQGPAKLPRTASTVPGIDALPGPPPQP